MQTCPKSILGQLINNWLMCAKATLALCMEENGQCHKIFKIVIYHKR